MAFCKGFRSAQISFDYNLWISFEAIQSNNSTTAAISGAVGALLSHGYCKC